MYIESPISSMKIFPFSDIFSCEEINTNRCTSSYSHKNLLIFGCNFTGPPSLICFSKTGTTDPVDPKTFLNRTIVKIVSFSLKQFVEYISRC